MISLNAMNPHRRIPFVGLLTLLAAMGCSSSPTTGQIGGTIFDGDEPLRSNDHYTWTVVFVGENGSQSGSPVGKDGSYSVQNVPLGKVQIAVVGSPMGGMYAKGEKRPTADAADLQRAKRLEKCKDPAKSGLTFVVESGKQEHNIRLPQ